MKTHLALCAVLGSSLLAVGCTAPAAPEVENVAEADQDLALGDLTVNFSNCIESIGVGLVPTANAQALTPDTFTLAGVGTPVTPIVARTSHCGGISINGGKAHAGSVVQVGAVVVPPDFTGDINSYTYWYYTTDADLAVRLLLRGVKAQWVPTLDYDYNATTQALDVDVSCPGSPKLHISGTVMPSAAPSGSFDANWWKKAASGTVKMETDVPVINIGSADLTLTTSANSALGKLIGGDTEQFPIIQQFNSFASATMTVSSL